MKIILPFVLFLCNSLLLQGQIIFTDNSEYLGNTLTRSGTPIGIADINNDGLDDIIRLHQTETLLIDFQNPDNPYFTGFVHGDLIGSNTSLSIADHDGNGYNDIFTGGNNNGLKLLKPQLPSTGFQLETISILPIDLQGSNFADIDNDGDLDIFACDQEGLSQVFRNDNNSYTYDVSLLMASSTTPSDNSGNAGSIWTDYDNDGDLDLYITKNNPDVTDPHDGTRKNLFFQNDGFNNYTDVAQSANLLPLAQSWAADFGDIDNDGDMDCFIINHDQNNGLYLNNGSGVFTNITTSSNLYPTMSTFPNGLQVKFVDFDNDSYLDIIYSTFNNGAAVFRNNGDNTFSYLPTAIPTTEDIHSFSTGDLDDDGYIDIIAGFGSSFNTPSPNVTDKMFINGGNGNSYVKVRLQGEVANYNGIGARIEMYDQFTGKQIREIRSGESHGISTSLTAHFGLSGAQFIDSLIVRWPSGTVDKIDFPDINTTHLIEEGEYCQPSVNFSSTINNTSVQFVENSTMGATSWLWDFGDGNTSTEQDPLHEYAEADNYFVCLTVTGLCGQGQICKTVNVNCLPPTAEHAITSIDDLTVSFVNTSTGIFNQSLWNFGDGTTSNETNPSHIFAEAGQYNVCLTVQNNCGSSQYCETVNVGCYQTQVGFEYSGVNLDVQFTDLSSDDVYSWLWDFGDGTTNTLQNPNHSYASEGTYNVCLTVLGVCGQRDICTNITIDCVNPLVFFSSTSNELTTTFNTNIVGDYTSTLWNFGDGNTSTDLNTSHTYAAPGQYTVCLEADGPCGSATTCNTITVSCSAPLVTIGYEDNGSLSYTFQGVAVPDNNTTWSWNFGDGNTSTEQNPTHVYSAPGTYTVTLSASNICGEATIQSTIDTDCQPPVSTFSTITDNLGITFIPSVNSPSINYTWDFGDGTSSNQATTFHQYAAPGEYTICLTASDVCGESTSCQTLIVGCETPVSNFEYSTDGLNVSFDYTGTEQVSSYFWMFGDGQTSTEENPTIAYEENGGYQVCLTVSNICGSSQYCETVSVGCEPPFAFFAVQQNGLAIILFNTSSNSATNWNWDFGDDNTSIEQSPTHTYNAPGTYNICMSAGNSCGSTQHCQEVVISCAEPQASFVYEVDDLTVNFTDISAAGPTLWFWNFGDGSPTNSNQNPSHTFDAAGQYEVCLVVNNVCGSSQSCQLIAVGCESPTPDFEATSDQLSVSFADLSNNEPTSWNWFFGDGNSSTSQNPVHTYAQAGTYTVCLESINDCGTNQLCKEVEVECLIAEADFSLTLSNLTVALTDASTNAPTAWTWDFGDGNTSTEQHPQYTYAEAGTYNICLIATNECGPSSSSCQTITLDCFAPESLFSIDGAGTTLIFNDQSTNEPNTWLWDFGDGNTSTAQHAEYTYSEATTYDVCLTVANDCGEDTNCLTVLVTSSTKEIDIFNSLELTPNPVQDNFSVHLNSTTYTDLIVDIVNVNGQQLFKNTQHIQTGENTLQFDVSHWNAGVYWIRLSHQDATTVLPFVVIE